MKLRKRVIAALVTAFAALAVFAANAFAAAPCMGPMYEPKVPEKLRK